MSILLLPTIGLFVLGLLVGRMWLVLLPAMGWPLFYLGLNLGWWGYGVGDAWWFVMGWVTVAGVLVTAAGVQIRRLIRGGSGHRSHP